MEYVSPILYEDYSCAELSFIATRQSQAVGELAGPQSERAVKDAASIAGVGLRPLYGDTWSTRELARIKGEAFAVQEAAKNKNCGLDIRLLASPKPLPM